MITERAAESFRRIFEKAALTRLVVQPGDRCEVIVQGQAPHAQTAERAVILTISSIVFRLMLVLHVQDNARSRAYYLREDSAVSFDDSFLEVANLCAGAINQELLRDFPDLGMSTPYVLGPQCELHFDSMKPDYLCRFAVDVGGDAEGEVAPVRLAATLCVCTDATLDFATEIDMAEAGGGELELF
ncbi:hypothetical protein [Robbsia sp. KACC 23696]|uniref:hypothetical protein n=1 Tax=Robbsia sp. KACC 23696 TaxID=3149231 RepID=UPI00325B0CA2